MIQLLAEKRPATVIKQRVLLPKGKESKRQSASGKLEGRSTMEGKVHMYCDKTAVTCLLNDKLVHIFINDLVVSSNTTPFYLSSF